MKKTLIFIVICIFMLLACSTQKDYGKVSALFTVVAPENPNNLNNQKPNNVQENKSEPFVLAPECIQKIYNTNMPLRRGVLLPGGQIKAVASCGGVIISEHLVVTVFHVLKEGEIIFIEYDGFIVDIGKVVKSDNLKRYALLEFPNVKFKSFAVPAAKMPNVGQKLYAIANDFNISAFFTEFIVGKIDFDGIIEVKPPTISGNSGFGVYNYNCELVGLITAYNEVNKNPVSGVIVPLTYFKEVFGDLNKNTDNNKKHSPEANPPMEGNNK